MPKRIADAEADALSSGPFNPTKTYDRNEAARELRVHPKTIARYDYRGLLKGFSVNGYLRRYTGAELNRLCTED